MAQFNKSKFFEIHKNITRTDDSRSIFDPEYKIVGVGLKCLQPPLTSFRGA
jgi:hypothetical protein